MCVVTERCNQVRSNLLLVFCYPMMLRSQFFEIFMLDHLIITKPTILINKLNHIMKFGFF